MQWVWIVLGAVLVVMVAIILYSFFVVRPRSGRQLRASLELLARETHGREPNVVVPAKCVSPPATRKELAGVGVLAVTDHGVVFAAADPDRTLIIERRGLSSATPGGSARGRLALQWTPESGPAGSAEFLVADPGVFQRALAVPDLGPATA